LKPLTTIALALVIVASSLGVIHVSQNRMNDMRGELTDAPPLENAPPELSLFVVVLGGFRGLLADVLFLRSQRMQEQERYFELVQLANWVVDLQPRFTGAISFLAWNMSYNISVNFSSPPERWRWVQRGYELIRDNAIPLHPDDPELYWELGWIFQHKMGMNLDNAHQTYKTQLALQMMQTLGSEEFDWDALAAAPRDYESFLLSLGDEAENFQRILATQDLSFRQFEHNFRNDRGAVPEAIAVDLEKRGITESTDIFLRATWLRERMKMDPVVIKEIIDRYGWLDFRLPDAHAIYWASIGLKHAEGEMNVKCDRMINQSLKSAFDQGLLLFASDRELRPQFAPNLKLADALRDLYLSTMDRYPQNNSFRSAFENHMVDAIVRLYLYGKKKKAAEYLDFMSKHPSFRANPRFHQPLEFFVIGETEEDIRDAGQEQANSIVQSFIMQTFGALAYRQYDQATVADQLGRRAHAVYSNGISSTGADNVRRGLDPYDVMAQRLLDYLRQQNPNFGQIIDEELALQKGEEPPSRPVVEPEEGDAREIESSRLQLQDDGR
jgi:hypothetical protein